MLRRLKRMPSGATAIAFTALLVALSGTAVALPGKNRVDSGDIRNNSVKSADIGRGQVKGSDVGRNAVSAAKVADNSLGGADVNESALGTVPSANTANSAGTAGNADTVDGYNASDISRGATAEDFVNSDGAATVNDSVLTATAPRAGGLLIVFQIACASNNGTMTSGWDFQLKVDGVNRGSGGPLFQRPQDGGVGSNLTLTTFAPVGPGDHDISYTASRSSGDATLDCNINTSSLFSPFSSAGTTPTARAGASSVGRGAAK